jgi:TolB-like protein/Tfp pilus assembly protein PilF
MPDPSLLQRLKERKLVQWALAYLAGAFVVFQLLDALDEPLGLSTGTHQAILALVVIGFFITLILAWYHGERGRQRVSGPELLMVAALLVVAGVALSMLSRGEEGPEPAETEALTPLEDTRPSIAVLPFDNFSPSPDDAYFADGMHEQVVSTLSRIRGLSVRGRTSVMRYRDDPKALPEIADELGVSFVLEGSARLAGDQVRLTAQLIDARRDEHVWSEQYDRELSVDNLLAVHSEIAEQIAHALQAVLTPEERAGIETKPTEDLEAYNEYLLGRFWWNKRTVEGLNRAIEHFERAIEFDSAYALAYAGIADSYALLPDYAVGTNPGEALGRAKAFAEKALTLRPDLAEPHASLGWVRLRSFDWDGAEEELRRAIELDPAYATAHQWYSWVLSRTGSNEAAIAEARLAVELDPLSSIINRVLGHHLYHAGQYQAAIDQYERTISLFPHDPVTWSRLALALFLSDSTAYATRAFTRFAALSGIDTVAAQHFVSLVSRHNRSGVASSLPAAFDTASGLRPLLRAKLAAVVGDESKALDWLEQAFREGWSISPLWLQPEFRPFRDHPRFQALLEKQGAAGTGD